MIIFIILFCNVMYLGFPMETDTTLIFSRNAEEQHLDLRQSRYYTFILEGMDRENQIEKKITVHYINMLICLSCITHFRQHGVLKY